MHRDTRRAGRISHRALFRSQSLVSSGREGVESGWSPVLQGRPTFGAGHLGRPHLYNLLDKILLDMKVPGELAWPDDRTD
jgi:hypothetical protein